ncbi:Zinc finger protein 930 [Apodemus speciosus]|uniref:Zinc finger protein 930 n=1 Tax=Apodemus speciosus TaxID=105296 RepID=A0ABQ0FVR4_APOSI
MNVINVVKPLHSTVTSNIIKEHILEKNLMNNECRKAFAISSHLQRHKTTHTEEKPYECNQCSTAFELHSTLQYHKRTHTGEKPYECNQWGKVCSQGEVSKVSLLERNLMNIIMN